MTRLLTVNTLQGTPRITHTRKKGACTSIYCTNHTIPHHCTSQRSLFCARRPQTQKITRVEGFKRRIIILLVFLTSLDATETTSHTVKTAPKAAQAHTADPAKHSLSTGDPPGPTLFWNRPSCFAVFEAFREGTTIERYGTVPYRYCTYHHCSFGLPHLFYSATG